jgi:hypothetical protein
MCSPWGKIWIFIHNVDSFHSSILQHHGLGSQFLQSHCTGPGLIPDQSMWELWWTKWHWDRLFSPWVLQISPVSIISPTLHIRLHLHVARTGRTDRWSLGTFQKAMLFQKMGSVRYNSAFAFFFFPFFKGLKTSQPITNYTLPLPLH